MQAQDAAAGSRPRGKRKAGKRNAKARKNASPQAGKQP